MYVSQTFPHAIVSNYPPGHMTPWTRLDTSHPPFLIDPWERLLIVIIDNEASRYFTVIEVNGRDRPGFLNKVAWTLTQLGLQIASSHIATYGERAVDVFYVKDVFGLKISHAGKRAQIEKALIEAIRESNALVTNESA